MNLWNIFWRTFAQLALAALLAVQGLDWTNAADVKVNGTTLGVALLAAVLGGLVAVLWAFAATPASTAVEKAVRSAAQAAAGGLGAIVLNTVADVVAVPALLLGIAVSVAFAFAITYFQNQPVPAAG
jgi:Na+-transporting NADH:ubiquinone oxidoreductase subunit NqrB